MVGSVVLLIIIPIINHNTNNRLQGGCVQLAIRGTLCLLSCLACSAWGTWGPGRPGNDWLRSGAAAGLCP